MRQKIALAVASLAATATLTIALAAAGFGQAAPAAAAVVAESTAAPTPIVQVDNVYLAPKPTQQTITIQQSAAGGENESTENEGAGDD